MKVVAQSNQIETTSTRRTKSHHVYVSRLVLQLSLPDQAEPGVKSRMKMYMWLEQRL